MLPFNLHILCREGDAGDISGGVEAILYIFLLWYLGHEDLSICQSPLVELLWLTSTA